MCVSLIRPAVLRFCKKFTVTKLNFFARFITKKCNYSILSALMLLLCRKYLDVHVSGTDLNLFIDIEVRNYKGGFASKSMMFISNFMKIPQLFESY